jgi:hypothetical protein
MMTFRRSFRAQSSILVVAAAVLLACICGTPTALAWVTKPSGISWTTATQRCSTVALNMADSVPEPTTFREAEVLGLRLMQEGDYQGALDGTFPLLSDSIYVNVCKFLNIYYCLYLHSL